MVSVAASTPASTVIRAFTSTRSITTAPRAGLGAVAAGGTRMSWTIPIAAGGGAAAIRASLDDHHRSVLGAKPSRALNVSAVSPLARHRSTRFRHLFVVSAIGRYDAPPRSVTPG